MASSSGLTPTPYFASMCSQPSLKSLKRRAILWTWSLKMSAFLLTYLGEHAITYVCDYYGENMKRACMPFLREWLNSPERQPLIIRGARQVGKTWLVRELAKVEKRELIELNFEDRRSLAALFFYKRAPHYFARTSIHDRKKNRSPKIRSFS